MTHAKAHRPRGFTLVELLVVIGIIALLVSVLLPALNRARESANQVKCMANMKQITTAMIMFANDHSGKMPSAGGSSVVYVDAAGVYRALPSNTDANLANPADWIAWRRAKDPITGTTPPDVIDQNITYSALAKYLGAKSKSTTGADAANRVDTALESVFRCPSDVLESRPNQDTQRGAYRYSYSMNQFWSGLKTGARYDGFFNGKLSSIKRASEKVLLVDEDEQSLNDGYFNPNYSQWVAGNFIDAVSSRHQKRAVVNNQQNKTIGNKDGLGNVGFCDGSVRVFSRKDALKAQFSGNPAADQ